jgi:hypothetical protein
MKYYDTATGQWFALDAENARTADTALGADKWNTARTITLGGDLSGSVSFDGASNFILNATVLDDSHAHVIGNVTGLQTALDAKLDATANAVSASKWATARTITVNGDANGSVTFDGSGNEFLTLAIVNDSHNHTISTVTGLQTALDAKLDATANAVSASKWATARTITLNGDLTGSVSLDGSANVTLTAAVKDDSHAHVISNIDGLETTLDNKLGISSNAVSASKLATARTITLIGDVSGSTTFDGSANRTITVTVNDDSHNHVTGNVDGLDTALSQRLQTGNPGTKITVTGTAPSGPSTNDLWIDTSA